ncbi:MAG TPA: hypothetical protein VJV79_35440 [Polyangiaceae bacterium]|nr:hypothetical protein [Polyangiaceae bacterium]
MTRFEVDDGYATRFERRIVGSQEHEELGVPAEVLAEFNEHIIGSVQIVEAHFGEGYRGLVPDSFGLKGKTAHDQFIVLSRTLSESGFDAVCEIAANHAAVFLNFSFWELEDFGSDGIDAGEHDRLVGVLKGCGRKGSARRFPLESPDARDWRRGFTTPAREKDCWGAGRSKFDPGTLQGALRAAPTLPNTRLGE